MSSAYPYNRAEECSWQPEELARHLASLATSNKSAETASTHLLSHGWSSRQVPSLKQMYGSNNMTGDENDYNNNKGFFQKIFLPVMSALSGQLKEPLIIMLLFSAGISLVLGNVADAVSIGIALFIVSLVAAIQEYRSEQAIEKLAYLVPHTCTVLRDGQIYDNFTANRLVVGDLVLLATGDRVPADCRVVDSVELLLDESSLTGEQNAVEKTGEGLVLGPKPALTDQANIVFAGTLVNSGRGRAVVVAVGEATEFGKIASELSTVTSRKSPLQNKIDELSQRLAALSTAAIVVIAILGWFMGRPILETLTVAVSLAVAAIPEGLPICVTVTLALGTLRMARKDAIVKKLPVVESLGCATTICSDKTGTLTQNEMTVRAVFTLAFPDAKFGFTGVGYSTSGKLMCSTSDTTTNPQTIDKHSDENVALQALFNTACLCNNATRVHDIDENNSGGALSGQPTELSLLVASEKAGFPDVRAQYTRIQETPFTSERRMMEVKARPVGGLHVCEAFNFAIQNYATHQQESYMSYRHSPRNRRASVDGSLFFAKGMPEKILGECTSYTLPDGSAGELTEDCKAQVLKQSRSMGASGLRVLAMAYGTSIESLTFAGICGMEDPPRDGVADCVRELRRGGVKVMMVTGDSKETALAIARRCGILGSEHDVAAASSGLDDLLLHHGHDGHSSPSLDDIELGGSVGMSGTEIDSIPVSDLANSLAGVKVLYRVVPRQKLTIVQALQKNGEIVAMTGDGVNDATALKGADIGVAMGSGTDVSKEAADIILARDDFQTLSYAIAEGKGIFFNIRAFLAFQLSTSFAALTMASVATAFGMPTPLNAMQILWINIIMDGPPAQSLGVEPVDAHILRAKPRKADDPIVTRALLLRAITSAAIIVFLTLKVFSNELDDGKTSRRDTTMTFMTFVNCDLFNAYVCRSADKCFHEMGFFSNPAFLWAIGGSIIGQFLVIYFPPLQEVFQTEALSPHDLLYIILLSSSVLWFDTLRKKFFSNWFSDGFNPSPRAKKEDPDMLTLPRQRSWLNFRHIPTDDKRNPTRAVRRGRKANTSLAL